MPASESDGCSGLYVPPRSAAARIAGRYATANGLGAA